MQTEVSQLVNVSAFFAKAVRVARCQTSRKFDLRQGLWIEDLRIPPGQECSNGSLILLAVVLWRIFAGSVRPSLPAVLGQGAPVTVDS
jgi:hypothetical protein